jgi:HAD superfamily hydrolase (TIGR01509 family)
MKLPAGLELIIFDCDGVLVDSEVLSMRAHQELFAELGAKPEVEVWQRCFGHSQAEIFAIMENAVGRVAPPELRATLWPRTKAAFAGELRAMHGVVEFLKSLDAPRCVASSSDPERIRFSLEVAGLLPFFDGRLFSARQVRRGKPWPDVFLYAAENMGVAPQATVVIEDSPPGVVAARAAGAKVIGFLGGAHVGVGHGLKLRDAGADFIAASWDEVRRFLKKSDAFGLKP